MYFTTCYAIDWDKVQTLDDVKRLFAAIQITFEPNNPMLPTILDLVHEEMKPQFGVSLSNSVGPAIG
ncbi:MAG: hypothetical protein Q7J73_02740 [Dehalococcoidales bacterium]|nr:hypothetical protein [Dehalococcoidales bacterium]